MSLQVAVIGDIFRTQVIYPVGESYQSKLDLGGACRFSRLLKNNNTDFNIDELPEPPVNPKLILETNAKDPAEIESLRVCIGAGLVTPHFVPIRPDSRLVVFYDLPKFSGDFAEWENNPIHLPDCHSALVTHHPSQLFKRVMPSNRENTLIVVSADALRDYDFGCRISSLSCEQAAIDLKRSMLNEKKKWAGLFEAAEHLVIPLGKFAAIYCHLKKSPPEDQDIGMYLGYSPQSGYDIPNSQAQTFDWFADFAAELVASFNGGWAKKEDGLFHGLAHCMDRSKHKYARLDIPTSANRPQDWSMLAQIGPSTNRKKTARDIAAEIIRKGLSQTAAHYNFPFATFKDLRTVDRHEAEELQSISNLIEEYLAASNNKPLCLAVFGPPGSGKSTGIKNVAKHLANRNSQHEIMRVELNLSGCSNLSELTHGLHISRNYTLEGKCPIVLIDEFDSAFEGKSYGWLKYLLAPMQDGEFREGDLIYKVGRAILVFIGGTRRTFEEFAGQMRNSEFIDAKGPDFVSRLRGHVNVRGINQIDDEDFLYPVRRAVALRYQLEQRLQKNDIDKEITLREFTDPLLQAFLQVKHYRHGSRSLDQIIRMCDIHSPQNQLTASSLPPRNQLDMHVDAKEFLELLEGQNQPK